MMASEAEVDDGMVDVVLGSGGDTNGHRDFAVDSFTKVEYGSWGDRMKSSCGGICIGLLFFFGSFGVLFWNEGRAVRRQRDLDEGIKAVVQVGNVGESIVGAFPDNNRDNINNKLVYVTGFLQQPYNSDEESIALLDPLLDLDITQATSGALKYSRVVETYQWVERHSYNTTKTSDGGTETEIIYTYEKQWSKALISSDTFKVSIGHVNPKRALVDPIKIQADRVVLDPHGYYALSDAIFNTKVNWWTAWNDPPIHPSSTLISDLDGQRTVQLADGGRSLYVGNNPKVPVIGDTRVTFQLVLPDTISIVAKYVAKDGMLESYRTSRGGEILLFARGTTTSDELFAQAKRNNTITTWFLRFVGFLAMCLGIVLMLQPLAVFVDIIPMVGDFMGEGLQNYVIPTIAFLISFTLSLLIISISWVFYRPVVLIISLALLGGLVFLAHKAVQAKKQATKPRPPNPNNKEDEEALSSGKMNGAEEAEVVVEPN